MKNKTDAQPPYTRHALSPFRQLIIDGLEVGRKKHYIKGFIEVDVTETRQAIRQYRRSRGNRLSFLAFFISCVVRALRDNPALNSGLKRNKIIQFKDIDVSVAIEMSLNGERVPRLMVLRAAQQKSAQDIHDEIAHAQQQNKEQSDVVQGDEKNIKLVKAVLRLPKWLRMLLWNRLLRDPFFTKRMMGTVGITSIGMFGKMNGWPEPIPTSNHTVSFALGSITKKPQVIRGEVAIREILHLTILMDHDIVDGAPAARFIEQLRRYVEQAQFEE